MSQYSLTGLDVEVTIPGIRIGGNVFVSSVSVVYSVNAPSTAVVSLGYRTTGGLAQLRRMFPKEGTQGVYYSTVEIKVIGSSTSLSALPGSFTLFKGLIVGFAHSKAVGNINFTVNAIGSPYLLSQIALAAPGLHSAGNGAPGVISIQGGSSAGNSPGSVTPEKLCKVFENTSDLFAALVQFVNIISEHYADGLDSATFGSKFIEAGISNYLYGSPTRQILQTEMASFDSVTSSAGDPVYFKDLGIVKLICKNIVTQYLANPQLSWLSFISTLFEEFGLDYISFGDGAIVTPKTTLMSLGSNSSVNIFLPTDEARLDVSDHAFQSPTRAVLTLPTTNDPSVIDRIAVFPDPRGSDGQEIKTSQEAATGEKVFFVRAPGWLRGIRSLSGYSEDGTVPEIDPENIRKSSSRVNPATFRTYRGERLKSRIDRDRSGTVRDILKDYAKYVFFKERFKFRSGQLKSRLKPEAVPGMPAIVNDVFNIATFECYVNRVTHTIDYPSAEAATYCDVSYIRYGGELQPRPFPNPVYPGFDISVLESKMSEVIGDTAGFFSKLRNDAALGAGNAG